jgi:hypothetical protein
VKRLAPAEGIEEVLMVSLATRVKTTSRIVELAPTTMAVATESAAIERLREFIAESGYEIVGCHEEEYLTCPTAKVPKTIVRYVVRKR